MAKLQELFPELGDPDKPKETEYKFARWERGEPELLILTIIEMRCDSCGTTYQFPSKNLLVRYNGQDFNLADGPVPKGYKDLPREVVRVNRTSEACQTCFEGPHF